MFFAGVLVTYWGH